MQATRVLIADPVVDGVLFFLHAVLKPVGGEHGNNGERKKKRADERESHGVRHGVEQFTGGAGERIDRQVARDDDGNGIKNGAIDVARGGEDDVGQFVFGAVAESELAVDVFHHHDGAVNDDAEIDCADGKEIRGFARQVEEDEREEESERNSQRGDNGGAEAHQEENQNNEDENHAAKKISFDGVSGDADEIAAVIVGADFYVRRQERFVDLVGFFLDAFEDVLGLFAAAHQDDAFDGVVILLLLGLKTEDAETRRVADFHAADILDADGHATGTSDYYFADVLSAFHQAQAAHVVKLPALGVKAATGVGIVGVQRCKHLHDRQVIVVKFHGIQQDVVLHRGPAKTRIVGHAGHALVHTFDDPFFVCVELHRRAVRTLENIAVDKTAGAEERRQARRYTLWQRGVADALKYNLPREVGVDAFVEGQSNVGEAVERDRAHDLEAR